MKFYIETLGCPKNFNDSETAAGILEHAGHQIVSSVQSADAILINTCGFIHDAKKESIDKIFDMAQYKKYNTLLIVSGCLAQRYQDELFLEMPEVDLFLGVNEYNTLPKILENYEKGTRKKYRSVCPGFYQESPFRKLKKNPYSATIKIAEGCDNICSYCVIPQIRGSYRSRREEDILTEAQILSDAGCKELILIAQDVTAYGMDLYGHPSLARLLKRLCKTEGIQWLRLMYCYEDRITDELIQAMQEEKKICNYIDMPLQHCNDSILRAMNRRSTKNSILSTIGRLRNAMPDIHIRSTLITGFPGEGTLEFEELLTFVETTKFERLGVFTYSREEGTTAAEMKEQLTEEVKQQRLDAIMRRQIEISLASNLKKVGSTLEIIVEETNSDGTFSGRSRYDAPDIDNSVIFTSPKGIKPGEFVNVQIKDAFDYDLLGEEV